MDVLECGMRLLKTEEGASEGVKMLLKLVEKEDVSEEVRGSASYALGFAFDAGQGVERNDNESRKWIERAARHGNEQGKLLVSLRRKDARRRRLMDFVVVFCVLVVVALGKTLFEMLYVIAHRKEFEKEVSGADPSTPVYVWHRNALNKSTRESLIASALALVAQTSEKNPLSESFAHSRGVVAHFTRKAFDDSYAFKSPHLDWLYEGYVRDRLDDRCNAFVFNVLVVPPGRFENRSKAVDFHVDQTLIQSFTQREQSAFTVSVGYVQVPRGISGGHLLVKGMRHYPHEGSVLVFRGDLNHAVSAFCVLPTESSSPTTTEGNYSCEIDTDPTKQRISFVLEQYRLPPEKLARSPSFILAPSDFEQELITVLSAFPLGPRIVELWLQVRKRTFWRNRGLSPADVGEEEL